MGQKAENLTQDLFKEVLLDIDLYKKENKPLEPYDLKEKLLEIRDHDEYHYHLALKVVPSELLADVLTEMPGHLQDEAAEYLGLTKLTKVTENMDTDDAADFIQNISEKHETIAESILENIDEEDREVLETLIAYDEDVAGAHMQSEVFSAKLDEQIGKSIDKLRKLKEDGEIDNIFHVFLIDKDDRFVCTIGLEEVIIMNFKENFQAILDQGEKNYSTVTANHKQEIDEVIELVSKYNISSLPVVDEDNKLLGRITSDDVYDLIEDQATEDIYHMAGVNAEAEQEVDLFKVAKSRGFWLGINLLTAIAASLVIGLFDATIEAYVSLAILMPIVASMGGNAGTQSLTVTVRQLAIGDIDEDDAKETIKKEIILSLCNGLFFALILGVISFFWFNLPLLGVVMALSTVINLLFAGLFGSMIPIFLEKIDVDPAIASSIFLTTVTDIVGFFSFLGLAKIIML